MDNNPKQASERMRFLPESLRDEAIEAAENVVDLRSVWQHKAKQRALEAAYRSPRKPDGRA